MLNGYFFLIIAALLFTYLLESLADLLNLRALSSPLPEELQGIYEPEAYKRSQEYLRVRTRFGLLVRSGRLALLLGFWLMGGFEWLDLHVRAPGYGPLPSGLLYIGSLFLAGNLLSLPLVLYSTFGIEARFGFNRTTPLTFLMDRIKGLLLAVILGGVLFAGLLWFFGSFPENGWIFAWLAITIFGLLLQFLAPSVIMPLFNKFTPLPEGELRGAIEELASRTRFPLKGVYVIDGSKRSTKANAFFTGFGKSRRIALYDTLLEKHTTAELTAILGHEIGHWKRGHILKSMGASMLETGLYLWILSLFLGSESLFVAFGMSHVSVYAAFLFFGLLYSPASLVLSVLENAWSRHNEYEADRFAVEHCDGSRDLTSALKTLSATNLSNLTPHPLMVLLEYSHPPLGDRLRAMVEHEKQLSSE